MQCAKRRKRPDFLIFSPHFFLVLFSCIITSIKIVTFAAAAVAATIADSFSFYLVYDWYNHTYNLFFCAFMARARASASKHMNERASERASARSFSPSWPSAARRIGYATTVFLYFLFPFSFRLVSFQCVVYRWRSLWHVLHGTVINSNYGTCKSAVSGFPTK